MTIANIILLIMFSITVGIIVYAIGLGGLIGVGAVMFAAYFVWRVVEVLNGN